MNIYFEKVTQKHLAIIFRWLAQDFVTEFWDNTQAHKDDIINFVEGRKIPSNYADGKYDYWLASSNNEPFAMFMTIQETFVDDINLEKLEKLSKIGNTYGLYYMIGNAAFFGKGYGAITLVEFINFFRHAVDAKADTFLIDPDCNNARAKHVYLKAGFKHVGDFIMKGDCSGAGRRHNLLIKKLAPTISLSQATIKDYPLIINMGRYYEYEMSRECGWPWEGEDGGYPSSHLINNFKTYFEQASRKAYLVKVYDEIAGFVLLNQATHDKSNQWNMGEFFVMAKFQGQGIAKNVANKIWEMYPGKWEISIILQNRKAFHFWERAISDFTGGIFNKSLTKVTYNTFNPRRIIFAFDSRKRKQLPPPSPLIVPQPVHSAITIDLLKNHPHAILQLAAIWQEALGKIWLPDISLEHVIAKFKNHLNDHILPITFIALDGKVPVGMCSLRENDGIRPEITPWLGSLVVDPTYQKQGIGKMLIDATKEKAKNLKFKKLYLLAFDPTLPDYYSRLGWKKMGMDEFKSHSVTVMEIEL